MTTQACLKSEFRIKISTAIKPEPAGCWMANKTASFLEIPMIASVLEVVDFKLDDGNVFSVRKSQNQFYLIPNEEIIDTANKLRLLANAQLKARLDRLRLLQKSQEHLSIKNGRLDVVQTASDSCNLSQKIVTHLYMLSESAVGGSTDILLTDWLYILKFFHHPIHIGSKKIEG